MTRRQIGSYLVDFSQQPQPHELPSFLDRPALPDGSLTGARYEAAVSVLAGWLRQQADKDEDKVLAEFVAAQGLAVALPDDVVLEAVDREPTIFEDEKDALLAGNRDRLLGRPNAWAGVVRCLETGQASAEFLTALAVLIKCNAIQRRAKVPAEKTAEVVLHSRHDVYHRIIEREFSPRKGQSERWSKAALAYEEMREGETLADAERRVGHDLKRRGKSLKTKMAIHAAIQRAGRCQAIPRPA